MLDVLDLSKNKITHVPDEIVHIYAVEIILNQNQISSLSEQVVYVFSYLLNMGYFKKYIILIPGFRLQVVQD